MAIVTILELSDRGADRLDILEHAAVDGLFLHCAGPGFSGHEFGVKSCLEKELKSC